MGVPLDSKGPKCIALRYPESEIGIARYMFRVLMASHELSEGSDNLASGSDTGFESHTTRTIREDYMTEAQGQYAGLPEFYVLDLFELDEDRTRKTLAKDRAVVRKAVGEYVIEKSQASVNSTEVVKE